MKCMLTPQTQNRKGLPNPRTQPPRNANATKHPQAERTKHLLASRTDTRRNPNLNQIQKIQT